MKQNKQALKLSDPVSDLTGIGPKVAEAFAKKDVNTINDLLFFLPRKYQDYSQIVPIVKLRPGQVTIKAMLSNVTSRRVRRGLSITQALASDESGSVRVVWFNQPYRAATLKPAMEYYLSGNFKLSSQHLALINPSCEVAGDMTLSSGRIVPIYSESKLLSSWLVRKAVAQALALAPRIRDYLPAYLLKNAQLDSLAEALTQIHFPDSNAELDKARRRFQFDELFPQLLANELSNQERRSQAAIVVDFKPDLAKSFVAKLPFKLTDDQRRVIWQIYQDMGGQLPMNRLVEGDVGSGKTVVAVMSALMAMAKGYKVAFIAPTELLARQHVATISALLKPLGLDEHLVVLTGSMKAVSKRAAIAKANKISGAFIVGTHSLFTSGVNWSDLALLIIDEQHRFGVDQRMSLQKQAGHLPHFLSITATPIPRSLALTIFNDLDISRLKQMPKGRKPITSKLVAPSEQVRLRQHLESELNAGRQLYVVCPYIHASESRENIAAETIFEQYRAQFKKHTVALIHSQLSSEEQAKVMNDFIKNKINILVATTIIEVGVDVANASVMIIYGPERFGLAQLHQLRGRVGRGQYQSYCYLMLSDSLSPPERLRRFIDIDDGFELSELDLSLRGPGAIYGKLQHGKGIGNMLTLDDHELITLVKSAVEQFIEKNEPLAKYPKLSAEVAAAQQLTNLN